MKRIIPSLLVLMASILMTSCYSHRVIGLLQEPTKNNKLPVYDSVPYQPYRLQVNDELIYRIITLDETFAKTLQAGNGGGMNNGQYANTYRIYSDGTIDLPFLKPIHVEGLTVEEAEDSLRIRFREIIPDADVKLALYNKTFTVIGEIGSGERYIYKEKMNIYEALAMTGDLRNSGNRKHVRIIRPRNGQDPEVLEFDIRTKSLIDSKYYYIYPNDIIYVERSKMAFWATGSYVGMLGLITSSVSLLVAVLTYYQNFTK